MPRGEPRTEFAVTSTSGITCDDVLDEAGCNEAKPLFWAIRDARDMTAAKSCSDALEATLATHNKSALASFLEAKQLTKRVQLRDKTGPLN